ncbi:MAG: dienelactone hydrolase family protein, partial [Actinomycetota bacterium]|nr:dienelactone hydrolase family protein [Actinomycetota bacterium]
MPTATPTASRFALLLAITGRYRTSAPFYGLAPKSMPHSCPIVASYERAGLILNSSPARLECNLTPLSVPHDVKHYPEASHSFYTHDLNRVAKLIGP